MTHKRWYFWKRNKIQGGFVSSKMMHTIVNVCYYKRINISLKQSLQILQIIQYLETKACIYKDDR